MQTKFIKLTDTHYGHNHKTHKRHEAILSKTRELIEKEDVKALIHAGDWISHNQHQLPRTWAMFRKHLGDIPILTVRGNHDFWCYDQFNKGKKGRFAKPYFHNFEEMLIEHHKWADDNNIYLMEKGPVIINHAVIFGFDGWYAFPGRTNDHNYMHRVIQSAPVAQYLGYKAYSDFARILEEVKDEKYSNLTKVLITHMPPFDLRLGDYMLDYMSANSSYMQFIIDNFNICCFGHTHFPVDIIIEGCRFINSGTDFKQNHGYNYSLAKIFEV